MRRGAPLALALAVSLAGCQGPRGPVILLSVSLETDPLVIAPVHRISVALRSSESGPETLLFPEAGPTARPLDFPTDLAVVVSGVEGSVGLEVSALDVEGMVVGWGRGAVSLGAAELVEASVVVGLDTTCGDGLPAPGGVPEVCLKRYGVELTLGEGDANLGLISNGVVFAKADADELVDLLAVWSEDNSEPMSRSGLSLYHGAWEAGLGTTFDVSRELTLVDPEGAPGPQRSNTEGLVANVAGKEGSWVPDALPDLVVSSRDAQGVTVWPKEGDGRTYYDSEPRFVPVGASTGVIQAGDLLPAPGIEVAVALWSEGALALLAHVGEGAEARLEVVERLPVRTGVSGFRVADLDGDGDADLVVASNGDKGQGLPGGLLALTNDGAGAFAAADVGPLRTGENDVEVADVNGDGRPDLASVNWETGEASLFHAAEGGGYGKAAVWDLRRRGEPLEPKLDRVRLGDVDGDALPDLIVCDQNGWLHLLLLDADGKPRFPVVRLYAGEKAAEPAKDLQGCDVADVDGDGTIDLVALVDRTDSKLRVLRRAR